jgi:hypothetical protein
MFHDFKELLSIFNAQKVKYRIVGGYAVSFHAQPRATKDLDLLIKPDADNAKAVFAVSRIRRSSRRTDSRGVHRARQVFSHGPSPGHGGHRSGNQRR